MKHSQRFGNMVPEVLNDTFVQGSTFMLGMNNSVKIRHIAKPKTVRL